MPIEHIQAETTKLSVDRAVEFLDRDGAIICENFYDERFMATLTTELDPYLGRTPNGEGLFFGRSTKRMGRLFLKSKASREMATNPWILDVMQTVLGRHCSEIQINLTQAIRIEPGERAQIFHNDDEFYPIAKQGAEFMINVLLACDDFTRENGATRLVPGSHKTSINRDPAETEVCVAEMPKGSVLIYRGSVLHGGGANRSAKPRTAAVISYSLGWLRQAENQYLAYPPDIAKTFPPELRRLIGYAIHKPNLGWYEGQDPRVLFTEVRPEFLAARDNVSEKTAEFIEQRYRQQAG